MADLFVPTVVILRVALLEPLDESAEGRLAGFDQQVDMVGHQAVGVDRASGGGTGSISRDRPDSRLD